MSEVFASARRLTSRKSEPLPSWHASHWIGEPGPSAGGRHRERAQLKPAVRRLRLLVDSDAGMSTAEYAIGTVAAAALGALLYTVLTGDGVLSALTEMIQRALTVDF
ncbi:DUF4244 domain-containing protein [Actinoalloteichus hymeniacidonis]|nr:DUF4244 domain-containing protein [Actinoalloteichus hymeniacidonis]MBB5910865.1 hypothetical protein [Actinoalloteichus hymeniacidonis]